MDESNEAECDDEIARISSITEADERMEGDKDEAQVRLHERENPPRPMSWDGELSDSEEMVEDVNDNKEQGLLKSDVSTNDVKPKIATNFEIPFQSCGLKETLKPNICASESNSSVKCNGKFPNSTLLSCDSFENSNIGLEQATSCSTNSVHSSSVTLGYGRNNTKQKNVNENLSISTVAIISNNNNNNFKNSNSNTSISTNNNNHCNNNNVGNLNNTVESSCATSSLTSASSTSGSGANCSGGGNVFCNSVPSSNAMSQQPPMNLSFPRIPPSPDSALGGWSTPSSNLSRHNSDASQRSFSSSSNNTTPPSPSNSPLLPHNRVVNKVDDLEGEHSEVFLSCNITSQGISRQQLINSPCPICGDRISGFHYGIFSCESCKGFFKRTVQNRKNYVCLRGATCHVAIATRKKCPACRFDKCLKVGMKLEAIREDRTRGGRSTYACNYSLPASSGSVSSQDTSQSNRASTWEIPNLLKEIVECESLWHLSSNGELEEEPDKSASASNTNSEYLTELCAAADRRLYKLVKWCKSLPLFKNMMVDDQTKLLLNSWCELLLFSCCYRSIPMPAGSIRINERLTLKEGDSNLNQCISRMIHFTDSLRRLRLDTIEYAALKVIILMSSEVDSLQEGNKVRESQESLLQCLQTYALSRCPESPSKFGELLLKIPELQRICQAGKEMLTGKAEVSCGFNLLFELLRGDH